MLNLKDIPLVGQLYQEFLIRVCDILIEADKEFTWDSAGNSSRAKIAIINTNSLQAVRKSLKPLDCLTKETIEFRYFFHPKFTRYFFVIKPDYFGGFEIYIDTNEYKTYSHYIHDFFKELFELYHDLKL